MKLISIINFVLCRIFYRILDIRCPWFRPKVVIENGFRLFTPTPKIFIHGKSFQCKTFGGLVVFSLFGQQQP